jgi:hypothetical protein
MGGNYANGDFGNIFDTHENALSGRGLVMCEKIEFREN